MIFNDVFFDDSDIIGNGDQVLAEKLTEEAATAHVKYLVLCPSTRSFLKASRRSSRNPVAIGFDHSVRDILVDVVRRIPGWRVMTVFPLNSTAFAGDVLPTPSSWTTSSSPSSLFGGRVDAMVKVMLLNFSVVGPPSVRTLRPHASRKEPTWERVVRGFVSYFLDLGARKCMHVSTSSVDVAVTSAVVFEEGKVSRHIFRGSAVSDPRAVNQHEDAQNLAG